MYKDSEGVSGSWPRIKEERVSEKGEGKEIKTEQERGGGRVRDSVERIVMEMR